MTRDQLEAICMVLSFIGIVAIFSVVVYFNDWKKKVVLKSGRSLYD